MNLTYMKPEEFQGDNLDGTKPPRSPKRKPRQRKPKVRHAKTKGTRSDVKAMIHTMSQDTALEVRRTAKFLRQPVAYVRAIIELGLLQHEKELRRDLLNKTIDKIRLDGEFARQQYQKQLDELAGKPVVIDPALPPAEPQEGTASE